jgi:hypothetical protein
VSVATAYHSVQAYLPENPQRAWMTEQRSQLHYRADLSRYRALAPVPGDEDEVFAVAAEAVQASGLELISWLVLCHSSLGTDHPELALRPLGGAPVPGALCPAQPAVQEYVCELAAEVDERFAPAALDLETPGWVTLPHHQHGKIGAELGSGARFAAGLCLCDACIELGAGDLTARFRGIDTTLDVEELLGDPEAAAFQRAREHVVTSLVSAISAAVNAKVHVAHWGDPRPAGVDYASLAQAADRITMLAYAPDPEEVERTLAPVISVCGAERVTAGLTLCHPEMPDEATFRACVDRCRALGVTALSIYNHSLVERPRLRWAAD